VQGRLIRAELTVVPEASASEIAVRMQYSLRPAGDTVVPLSIVLFDSASISDVHVSLDGRTVPVEGLADGSTSHRSGTIRLAPSSAAMDSLRLDLDYTVHTRENGNRVRIQVPVMAVTWPPEEAGPRTFLATLQAPPGYSAWDPLPSGLREIRHDGGARWYEASLQVVPAIFSFRLGEGRAPRFGLSAFLDTSVVVLLAVFTWIGWRHFREGD
jgi:hypothetical protein